jgi:hypothetical protein
MASKVRNLLVLLVLLATSAQAATNTAASTSRTDVQAAIDASSNGDTVMIPSGSATWTGIVEILDKSLHLKGSGQGQTIITANGLGSPTAGCDGLICAMIPTNKFVRVSEMTIVGDASDSASISLLLRNNGAFAWVNNVGTPGFFHVWNVTFTNISTRAIKFVNNVEGLVDHCTFYGLSGGNPTMFSPDGTEDHSSNRWSTAATTLRGTTNQIVIESCNVSMSSQANGVIDSYSGQAYTFRFNNVTNGNIGNHGTDSSGANRSTLSVEAYGNTIYLTNSISSAFEFRGGTQLVFSNTITLLSGGSSSIGAGVSLANYRNGADRYNAPPPGQDRTDDLRGHEHHSGKCSGLRLGEYLQREF